MPATSLRSKTALVAASRASVGGALLAVGLVLGYLGRVGDFGVLARALSIAHLTVQLTDTGGLAAMAARSGDPTWSEASRHSSYRRLVRRVGERTLLLVVPVAAVAALFDVPAIIGAAIFVGVSLQRLASELLRSDGRIERYALTAGVVPSSIWLVAIVAAALAGAEITTAVLGLSYAAALTVVAVVALQWLLATGRGLVANGAEPVPPPVSLPVSLPGQPGLFVEGALEAAVRNADVVLITLVATGHEAGLYALATKLVAVALTPLAAANGALVREYSERWSDGGGQGLSTLAQRVARRITPFPAALLAASIIVALVAADGTDPQTGASVAAVLLTGATVSTAAGSAGLLLGVCRREAASATISAVTIALSMILLLALGAVGGLIPAAIGFTIGVAVQNIWQSLYLRTRVGVRSHV